MILALTLPSLNLGRAVMVEYFLLSRLLIDLGHVKKPSGPVHHLPSRCCQMGRRGEAGRGQAEGRDGRKITRPHLPDPMPSNVFPKIIGYTLLHSLPNGDVEDQKLCLV